MSIKHILHNFTVFVDGKGKIGRVNEFTPPNHPHHHAGCFVG